MLHFVFTGVSKILLSYGICFGTIRYILSEPHHSLSYWLPGGLKCIFFSFISELQTSEGLRATEQAHHSHIQAVLQQSLKLRTVPASLFHCVFSTARLPVHFKRTPFYSRHSGEDQITLVYVILYQTFRFLVIICLYYTAYQKKKNQTPKPHQGNTCIKYILLFTLPYWFHANGCVLFLLSLPAW